MVQVDTMTQLTQLRLSGDLIRVLSQKTTQKTIGISAGVNVQHQVGLSKNFLIG